MSKHDSRGFTLIELLVVIGIVALLLSVLLPALRMARQEGMTAKCLSNLRSIATFNTMYFQEQGNYRMQWYTHQGLWGMAPYDVFSGEVNELTPWVFGGNKAPKPAPEDSNTDSTIYPTNIRPLNRFASPMATDHEELQVYRCPGDRSYQVSVIGSGPSGSFEEERSSWDANGSSFTLNTRFMQGYQGQNGQSGDFNVSANSHDLYMNRIARHMTGGDSSRFVLWMEIGMYSATYRASNVFPNGAGPLRSGWHRKFSKWSMAFADGHVVNAYYDTRKANQQVGTIWQPNLSQ